MAKEYVRYVGGVVLLDPESGAPVVPPADEVFDTDHPLVRKYRWAFQSDAELAEAQDAARGVTSVVVEQATARPGERRNTRRS